jgi:hypothetical protein
MMGIQTTETVAPIYASLSLDTSAQVDPRQLQTLALKFAAMVSSSLRHVMMAIQLVRMDAHQTVLLNLDILAVGEALPNQTFAPRYVVTAES